MQSFLSGLTGQVQSQTFSLSLDGHFDEAAWFATHRNLAGGNPEAGGRAGTLAKRDNGRWTSLRPSLAQEGEDEVAQTVVYAAKSQERSLGGWARCKKLLLYRKQWQYLCAMLTGYARVSTGDQETAAQVTALKAAGCERIYREQASGRRRDRRYPRCMPDQRSRLSVWYPYMEILADLKRKAG